MKAWGRAALALAVLASSAGPALAFHTSFLYRVDRFDADGNTFGSFDGVPDVVDEFDAPPLGPNWAGTFGTFSEADGYLVLNSPGGHYPAADGGTLDMSVAGSTGSLVATNGFGDFSGTAYWEGVIPELHHHYYFAIFTFGGAVDEYDAEVFGIAIRRTDTAVEIEQHMFELNRFAGAYRNVNFWFDAIDPADVTGRLVFRIRVDDSTDMATSEFSLDGGTTWQSPFPGQRIFETRGYAQFILGADPAADPNFPTTTSSTTVSSSTTSTTLCVIDACRRSIVPFQGKLALTSELVSGYPAPKARWKWAAGEATALTDFGDPTAGDSTFCVATATGTLLTYTTFWPSTSWSPKGSAGYKWVDPSYPGNKVMLRAGKDGVARVAVKAKWLWITPYGFSLPLQLPIVARFTLPNGECFGEYFGPTGALTNTAKKFVGKPGSPGGAFVDWTP